MLKKILLGLLALVAVVLLGGGTFIFLRVRGVDASLEKVYDVPLPTVTRTNDAAEIERGKHLVEAVGGCYACHGDNMAGGRVEDIGPLGTLVFPNATAGKGARGEHYTDAELARLLKHGIRRDGRSARMMPAFEWSWWPDSDVAAVISYLRTVPPVDGDPGVVEFSAMGKFLDTIDAIPIDAARRIDHASLPVAPPRAPTKEYGAMLAISCRGCHGEHLSGGPIPGAPSNIPIPLNLTLHETGLAGFAFEDFEKVARTGVRKDGRKLDPFMPIEALKNYDDTEMRAVWEYLRSVPPRPFGER